MNIGVHFFDILIWIFGPPERSELHLKTPKKMSGLVELERAKVRWFLSVDASDLPDSCHQSSKFAHRSMTIDGQEIEFSKGFTDLHTKFYQGVLEGKATGIQDARPAIELVHSINRSDVVTHPRDVHPLLDRISVYEHTFGRKAG
jgi:UDP-N-acetyl-2-amino-2-deoxyglucuronate dehydrogenase